MLTNHAELLKKLPSWLYKLGSQAYIDYEYPRHLFIETTASCNLSCSYCPREKTNKHMEFRLFTSLIDEASLYGSRSFSLHLFGEPLLYPKWHEAIRYIKDKNPKHTVLFTTNGTLLDKLVDRVIEANPDKILWTWRKEAKFSEETKEKLRKWGKFCVRIIKEITPKEALDEWKDWSQIEYRNLHNYGGAIDISQWNAPPVETRWPCYHLWLAPAVAWNGNILLCCADPHQKEVIGQFGKDTVSKVWQGERIKAVREAHLRGDYTGICAKCDVWKGTPDIWFQHQKQ